MSVSREARRESRNLRPGREDDQVHSVKNLIVEREHGFSLVELMVSLFIFGVIITLALGYMYNLQHRSLHDVTRAEAQQIVRTATGLIATELRHAGFHRDPATMDTMNGGRVFFTANAANVEFEADLVGDTVWSDLMSYYFTDGTIYRKTKFWDGSTWDSAVDILAERIASLDFAYFTYDPNLEQWVRISIPVVTDSLGLIRAVRIQTSIVDRSRDTSSLGTWVLLRNR